MPENRDENYYIASTFGSSFLGVIGEFTNLTVRWKNVYTEKEIQNPEWFYNAAAPDAHPFPHLNHIAHQLPTAEWYPIGKKSKVAKAKVICIDPTPIDSSRPIEGVYNIDAVF